MEKRWISANEFALLKANGVKVCTYGLPPTGERTTELFCGAAVRDGDRCEECRITRSPVSSSFHPVRAPFPPTRGHGRGAQDQPRWLTLDQFLEESKQHFPICSYMPNRGLNRDHVCGAFAVNTRIEPSNLLWRCLRCRDKRGDIQKRMVAPAPVAPPAPTPTSSDVKITETTSSAEQMTVGDPSVAEMVPQEPEQSMDDLLIESSLAWLKQVFPDENNLRYFLKFAAATLDTAK